MSDDTRGIVATARAFVAELFSTEPELDDVDTQYLLSEDVNYRYMTFTDEQCRCDLCGRVFKIEAAPDLVAHVGDHDQHGSAEIDPFEIAPSATEWEIEVADKREPAEI